MRESGGYRESVEVIIRCKQRKKYKEHNGKVIRFWHQCQFIRVILNCSRSQNKL